MLYKNGDLYKLSPAEIKEVEKFFHGKFPVKVVYPKERIVKSRLPHNRLPDKPNSIAFDLKSVVKTDSGSEIWRYADEVIMDDKGNKKYVPKKFRFNGSRFLDRNDIELIFFLWKKSSYCSGGKNQGKIVKFLFEDLVTEAEKKAEKKAQESRIDLLLFNEEMGLPEEKLRLLAKAYFINDVDKLTLAQVKIMLDTKIHNDKAGVDKFFDMVNADEELTVRTSIQKAIDMKILGYNDPKKEWEWLLPDGGKTKVCKVPPNKTPHVAIYDTYLGDKGFREDLTAALITKNPKAGDKGKKGKGADDEVGDE